MSNLEFIKSERILTESIQDECFQMSSVFLHSPVSITKEGKQISGKEAVEILAREDDPTLVEDLETFLNNLLADSAEHKTSSKKKPVIVQSFMQQLVSKQFPKFTLKPKVDRHIINIEQVLDPKHHQGEVDASASLGMNEYIVDLNIYIIRNVSTPSSVQDSLFHELVHFCQAMLAPIQTTGKKISLQKELETPPNLKDEYKGVRYQDIKYSDKAYMPQSKYSAWENTGDAEAVLKTYENKPTEIEANMYDTVYKVLSKKTTRKYSRGFTTIDRLCQIPSFVNKLPQVIKNPEPSHAALLDLVISYCMREPVIVNTYNKLSDYSSKSAEDFLGLDIQRKNPMPAINDIKKRSIFKELVTNFVYSNLATILTQIKLNLGNKIPGLAEFIG